MEEEEKVQKEEWKDDDMKINPYPKGKRERPESEYKILGTRSKLNQDEPFVVKDKNKGGYNIVWPMNQHSTNGINEIEQLISLQHENVMSFTGYFRDSEHHLYLTAELPLLADLAT